MLKQIDSIGKVLLCILFISNALSVDIAFCSIDESETSKTIEDMMRLPLRFGRIAEEKDIMLDSLPNGLALIPNSNETPLNIFSFSKAPNIQRNPYYTNADSNQAVPEEVVFENIRNRKVGDLMYNLNEEAIIAVSSMQVRLLGEGLLSDLRGIVVEPDLETLQKIPARLGLRYMVRTTDGKFGLFRIIAVAKRAIMIQWIYQPDGSSSFTGTGNFLDRQIIHFYGQAQPMTNGIQSLRNRGFRVCFEAIDGDSALDEEKIWITMQDTSVKALLDELVSKTQRYQWEAIKETNIICIYPRENSFLNLIVEKSQLKLPIKNRPYLSIIENMQLDKYNIRFPHWKGLPIFIGKMSPPPTDRNLSIILDSDFSIKQILVKICFAYGDGMYFILDRFEEGTKGLFFETKPSLRELSLLE